MSRDDKWHKSRLAGEFDVTADTVQHKEGCCRDLWMRPGMFEGEWDVYVDREDGFAEISTDDLVAWCRRIQRKVDPDSVQPLDEAAIRADEAEKIAAYLDAKSDTLLDGRHAILVEERDVTGWNMRAAECDALESAAGDIRAGKHRSST